MIGTIINGAAIVVGGVAGLTVGKQLSRETQNYIKMVLGVLVVWVGMTTIWKLLNGRFGQVMGQIGIMMLSVVLGNVVGKMLRLQKGINRLGQMAAAKFESAGDGAKRTFGEGFITCTILFCVGPMAILGSLADGVSGDYKKLALKGLMDGVAAMAFVRTFGWGVILSAIPVIAYQGTITLFAGSLQPYLQNHALLDSVNATGGMLIVTISLTIFEFRKVPLADYLPALVIAPLLTYWWR